MLSVREYIALGCLGWYLFIALVCSIGCAQLFRHYRRPPAQARSVGLPAERTPHVTIIRPCKGKEPYLYECLASTCQQDYPINKLSIHVCVASRDDAAYSIMQRVLKNFPEHDMRLLVEEDDPCLRDDGANSQRFGPNPKIRNMSRSYREAKGDIVWILDCNIWVSKGTCGRMVDKLCCFSSDASAKPYKFVHQLPIAIDVDITNSGMNGSLSATYDNASALPAQSLGLAMRRKQFINDGGGRLDELFLASSHAKMYVAISTVAVAPCICGKSNMFRSSHLNALTNVDGSQETRFGSGLDYFSHNICEDHLMGDLLWKSKTPKTVRTATGCDNLRNHGLVYGDLAIQPVAGMSVSNYAARRVRWLRVRKFTVPVATLVEPGTESFVCSAIGAWGITTSDITKSLFGTTWKHFAICWMLSVFLWAVVDRMVYTLLLSGATVEGEHKTQKVSNIPVFAKPLERAPWQARRSFRPWFTAWLGREALAFPIWMWATWGGVTVTWRDQKFWVGLNMKVHPLKTNQVRRNVYGNGSVQANGLSYMSEAKGKQS